MRAVVKVKPMGGKGASRVARYIAESKLDPAREGKSRLLFSDRADDLAGSDDRTYRAADRYLTGGFGAPRKRDLIHFSVSFRAEDFERLGAGDEERKERLRETAREAMAEIQADLNVSDWRWIAGIHLNTPHPHVHIVIHKEVTDSKTALPRRLGKLPKRMLPHSKREADGAIRPVSGGVAGHFIAALELAQERAREAARAREENAMALTTEQIRVDQPKEFQIWLLDLASRTPSLAGRDLAMEIVARGPEPEPGERVNPADDIRDALRSRSLDDSAYQTQIEQADELGRRSRELRDLYERGAEIKGETLIIPAEEYEISDERDHIRVINLSHAFEKEKIRDPKTAVEFHSLARAIAGETSDIETEIKVFKHYYDRIERDADGRRLDRHSEDYEQERAAALDRTIAEMRGLAREMASFETRESIDIVPSMMERSHVHRHIQDHERASEFYALAQAITGPDADLQRESQIFSYYYGKLDRDEEGHKLAPDNDAGRLKAVERTLVEMRQAIKQKAEIPEHVDAAHVVVSFEEETERENGPGYEEGHSFAGDSLDLEAGDDIDDLDGPEYEYTLEEAYGEREAEATAWQFNTAARKVNLSGERLRFPAGLTAETREWLVGRKLPEIDRRIENGEVLYDKREKDGAVREKGVLSDINRLIQPERDEMLSKVSEAAGLDAYEALARPPGPDEIAEARRILIELSAHEQKEMERRRELRSRLEAADKRDQRKGREGTAPDRSYIFNDYTASRLERIESLVGGLQKSQAETDEGRVLSHPSGSRLYVSLSNGKDSPRLPVSDIRVYDAIEKMATGAKLELSTWIGKDGPPLINGFTEKEYNYRAKVVGFLKSYTHERLRDPETRLTHDDEIFRNARKSLNQARNPEELNRVAYDFMSRNERQGGLIGERERWMLFNGRSPDHHMPEMVNLRLTWGLPREGREQALGDERLPPSPTLKVMLGELETRRNVESVRQFQKSLITPPEKMRNPGRLPLYQMHKILLGHERDYVYHQTDEMKRHLPSKDPSGREAEKTREEAPTGRAFGEIPRESRSYKEYIASLGEIKQRLLEETASRVSDGVVNSIEQTQIHNRACSLAWGRLATEEVFSARPSEQALRLSATIAKLQQEAQPRARQASQVLDEFSKENIPSYANGRVPKAALQGLAAPHRERYEQLKNYAGSSREDLYRGFETIDGLRQELEKSRANELMKDRVAMGNAVITEARYEYQKRDYETARDHGETFRFRIRDVSSQMDIRISALDIERRAGARGARAAEESVSARGEKRREIGREVAASDLSNHADTLREHGVARSNLVNKLEVEAMRAASERELAQARAQQVTRKYQERGEQPPPPFINRKTLMETQEQTIKRGLVDHTEKLEQIRLAQSLEFKRPARTKEEAARLGAQLFVAQTELQAREETAARFDRTRHLRQWETSGGQWSLTDVDRRIERQSDETQIFGRHHLHLVPGDRRSARDEIERLTATREEISSRISEQRSQLRDKTGETGRLVEILSQAYERESESRAQTGQAMPDPKFKRDEFERIADNAATTRDAATLKRLDGFERQFNSYADPKERVEPERRLARARGREAMAEVFFQESADRLSKFQDRGEAQPLLIETTDGRLITQSVRDTAPRSILEQITRPLIEAPAARELREATQTALEHQRQNLVSDLEKSRTYYEAAREIARLLSPERNYDGPGYMTPPEFSSKEERNIEIYAERLTDERLRERYIGLLDPARFSATPRNTSHNDPDHSREAATPVPDAPAHGVGRGR